MNDYDSSGGFLGKPLPLSSETLVKAARPGAKNPKDRAALAEGRVPLHLIPAQALVPVAMAMKDGAQKYGPYNWRTDEVTTLVYLGAALRHLYSYLDGEQVADDSQVHHLAHAIASLLILIDAELCGKLIDDRPPPVATGAIMEAIKRRAGRSERVVHTSRDVDPDPVDREA